MKVRDSGMPGQDYWETLLDVPAILDGLGLDSRVNDAIEIGCGYGTFTLPLARRIRGTLHAFDIDRAMVAQTRTRLSAAQVANVAVYERDVIADGFPAGAANVDAVLLFNILHTENPVELLDKSARTLSPGGRVAVIHWRSDVPTPRGPDLSIRPQPEQVLAWARSTGLVVVDGPPRILPPWHFGVTLHRLA
jgi:SAM-dependent methyltransferase